MKKVISQLLIVATFLTPCCKSTYADRTAFQRATTSASKLNKDDLKNFFSELAKDPDFSEALKEALLELSKDKQFTDQVIKNYENAHKDPFWLKIVKLPFKAVWYLIKTTFNYVVGKNVAKFLTWVLPIAMFTLDLRLGFTITSTLAADIYRLVRWILV